MISPLILSLQRSCGLPILVVAQSTIGRSKEGMTVMSHESVRDVQPIAQSALANSPIFELRDLHVDTENATLMISGSVSSFYHKQLAQEVVRAVCKECNDIEIDLVNSIQVQ